MYTIYMNQNKDLIQTNRIAIYQKETNADKIQFLFPQYYGDIDLSLCEIIMYYINPGNEIKKDKLIIEPNLYKDRLQCIYDITSKFTRFSGNVKLSISFLSYDEETNKYEEVLHTGESVISIQKKDIFFSHDYDDSTDENIEYVKQALQKQEELYNATKVLAETFDKTKADGLHYKENILSLTSNGDIIDGSEVEISTCNGDHSGSDYDPNGTPIVDFDNDSNTNIDDNKEVVEF